jgi:Zn-dependent oligopeptidase
VKVDEAEIKKYFETEATIEAMFDIWLKLFGVKVVEDKKAPRFDKDVKVYKCLDAKTKKSIGVVIFDL